MLPFFVKGFSDNFLHQRRKRVIFKILRRDKKSVAAGWQRLDLCFDDCQSQVKMRKHVFDGFFRDFPISRKRQRFVRAPRQFGQTGQQSFFAAFADQNVARFVFDPERISFFDVFLQLDNIRNRFSDSFLKSGAVRV